MVDEEEEDGPSQSTVGLLCFMLLHTQREKCW